MKKTTYILFFILPLFVVSCTVDDVTNGNTLQLERVNALEEQIPAINASIADLQKVGEILTEVIDSLEWEMALLETDLERQISSEIRDSGHIEALRARISELDKCLPGLESADSSLNAQIDDLREHISHLADSVDTDTQTWLRNTFVTLSEMDSLCGVASDIYVQMEQFDESFKSDLSAALSELETSIQKWVTDSLTGYYTIEVMDARLTQLSRADSTLSSQVEMLGVNIDTARAQLTRSYQNMLRTSIETLQGKITQDLADSISAAKSNLEEQLKVIDTQVSALEKRVEEAESDADCILSRIRSFSVVADRKDGSIGVTLHSDCEIRLSVYPLEAADSIARYGISTRIEVMMTDTKTPSIFSVITPKSVKYEDELLKLVFSSDSLPASAFSGEKRPFLRVVFFSDRYATGSSFFPLSYDVPDISASFVEKFHTGWSGEKITLDYNSVPESYGPEFFSFTSSNPLIASVDEKGILTGHKPGVVRITLRVKGEEEIADICRVDVIPADALKGRFSFGDGKYGYFSRGVLRAVKNKSYTAEKDQWENADFHFAPDETSVLAEKNLSGTVLADSVDLFGWSSVNGYKNEVPWGISTSTSYQSYEGDFRDWGTKIGKGWKTLSKEEWDYMINTRPNSSSLKKKYVTVGSYSNSSVIAPDDYTGTLRDYYATGEAEKEGLVCLIKTYYRFGTSLQSSGSGYRTRTIYPNDQTKAYFLEYSLYLSTWKHLYDADMVRLIFVPTDCEQ